MRPPTASVTSGSVRTALTAALGVAAVLVLDPQHRHVPLCPFHAATGLQCPLCGSLRAVQALTRLDVAAALRANLLLVAAVPVLAALWLDGLHRERDGRPRRSWPRGAVAVLVALALVFAVVRNLPGAGWLRPVS